MTASECAISPPTISAIMKRKHSVVPMSSFRCASLTDELGPPDTNRASESAPILLSTVAEGYRFR